jgi:hypothetical protein
MFACVELFMMNKDLFADLVRRRFSVLPSSTFVLWKLPSSVLPFFLARESRTKTALQILADSASENLWGWILPRHS